MRNIKNSDKEELVTAQKELVKLKEVTAKMAAELSIAQKELTFQNVEKRGW